MFNDRQQFCLAIYGRHSVSYLRDTHVWVPVSDIDCRLVSNSDAAARRHSRLVCTHKIAKNRHLGTTSTCPYNMANFGPLAAEILSLVWGTPCNFNGFRVLAALLHGNLVVGVSQTAALNRGRHLYSAGRPSRWVFDLPHF